MATTISITLTDTATPRVLNAFASHYGWTAQIELDGVLSPNPETKGQHAKRRLIEMVMTLVREEEAKAAATAARIAAEQDVTTNIVIT